MIEKLLENWLDSASERSYQPVFVQLLAAEGYTVLHSTRHCLLEFGKDILAVAPDGVGCAFQLKGAPKSRMTIGEFRREIQQQLVQLMAQAPSYPGFPAGPHRAFLVSNGQFEEEVQVAVREMNQMPFPAKVELWSRGKLFELCKRNGAALWPGELDDNRALLELYMADPRDLLPVATLSKMLASVLSLNSDSPLSRPEFTRVVSSAIWLTGISTATFAERENHFAVVTAWTICAVSLIAAGEHHNNAELPALKTSLELALSALLDGLSGLLEEIIGRENLIEGEAMADPEVFGWRMSLLYGLLTCLAIADAELKLLASSSRNFLHAWLKNIRLSGILWGEAAMACLVPWLVWLRRNRSDQIPDQLISIFAKANFSRNQPRSSAPLPSPYYQGEAVLRHWNALLGKYPLAVPENETFAGSSYTSEALMHLLVRTKLKGECKALWPAFTKLAHHKIVLDSSRDYCLLRSETGTNETKVYPSTYEWSELRNNALSKPRSNLIPTQLCRKPWLLGLWWIIAPHRFDSEALWHFTEAVLPGWGT